MSKRTTCTCCGRRFHAAAALPVSVTLVKAFGDRVRTEQRWEPGCPECFAWDDDEKAFVIRKRVAQS